MRQDGHAASPVAPAAAPPPGSAVIGDRRASRPPGAAPRPGPVVERLAIRPRGDACWVDVVPRDPPGAAPIATLPVDLGSVLLDAVRVPGPLGGTIYASEFAPAAQRSRVRRFRARPGGGHAVDDVLVGATGDVLWWLHVRDGALRVREIGRGTSYVVFGALPPHPAAPGPAAPGASSPAA